MANTIAAAQNLRTSPKAAQVGVLPLSIVSTEVYATASGGFTADISTLLAAFGIAFADVIALVPVGPTLTGHMPSAIKTTTAGTFTIRLWNGSTEIANGALTQTLQLLVLYSQGAAS